jgi:hypothetical protein
LDRSKVASLNFMCFKDADWQKRYLVKVIYSRDINAQGIYK